MFLKTISKFTHFSGKKRPTQRFYHCFTIKRQNMKPYPVIARQHKPPRSPLCTIAGKHFAIPVRIWIFGAKHTVFHKPLIFKYLRLFFIIL